MNREMQVRRVMASIEQLILSAKVTEVEEIRVLTDAQNKLGIIAARYKLKALTKALP